MNKLYSETAVQAIADNLRKNLGNTETYKISEMATGVQTAIDKYKQNNPTATSTNGNLTNAYDVPMVDYEIDGKSEQNSTTGKNKAKNPINKQYSYPATNPTIFINTVNTIYNIENHANVSYDLNIGERTGTWLPITYSEANDYHLTRFGGTYKISVNLLTNEIQGTNNNGFTIYTNKRNTSFLYINVNTTLGNKTTTITLDDDEYIKSIYLWSNGENTLNKFSFTMQLEEGSTATSYEPYTGGQPSPSPDYPQEIRAVGDLVESGEHAGKYEIPVRVRGTNKYNVFDEIASKTRYTTVDSDGWITMSYDNTNGSSTAYPYYSTHNLNLKTNTQYTLMVEIKEKTGNISMEFASVHNLSQNNTNIYTSSGSLSVGIRKYLITTKPSFDGTSEGLRTVGSISAGQSGSITFRLSVLEDTSITLSDFVYEKYHSSITTPIYLDRPLYNLPSGVKDKIRFSTGKRTNAVGEVVLDGSETELNCMEVISAYDKAVMRYTEVLPVAGSGARANGLSNYFIGDTSVYAQNDKLGFYFNSTNLTNFAILLSTIGATSSSTTAQCLALFKQWLSTHNTQILYELATPTEESIDLPQLNLCEGTNIIEIGTEVQPSEVEYVYIIKKDSAVQMAVDEAIGGEY